MLAHYDFPGSEFACLIPKSKHSKTTAEHVESTPMGYLANSLNSISYVEVDRDAENFERVDLFDDWEKDNVVLNEYCHWKKNENFLKITGVIFF